MECCSQIQKCNLDNKAFNEAKAKYAGHSKINQNTKDGGNNEQLMQENAWFRVKFE